MYQFIALVELIIFIAIIIKFIKKDGIISIVDGAKMMTMIWGIVIILYNLKLSKLYSPTIEINLIIASICICFLIVSKYNKLQSDDIKQLQKEFQQKNFYRVYSIFSTMIVIVGTALFFYNVWKHGLAILAKNKIDKQNMDHYAAYIIYMLVLAGEVKYILFREYKKMSELIMFLGTIFVLFLTLNRGPITFLLMTIIIYEIFNFINIKDRLTKKKIYIIYFLFLSLIIIFIYFFGYIGNIRMEYALEVYNKNIWQHYQFKYMIPSGLVWIYIYLTSPLENVAFFITNYNIKKYTLFSNLLYPFTKFVANIFGCGEQYKKWIMLNSYSPYLEEKVGLNAKTFILDAFQDFGIVGFIVYLLIYVYLAYIALKIIKGKGKYTPIGKVIMYTNIISVVLWSIFGNSFKISILILNILLMVLLEKTIKIYYKRKKGNQNG